MSSLERDPLLAERLKRLRTVPGVGPITALTWVLEIGDVVRFQSIKQAISYCGLCGAERSSADKVMRTPISKQRNKHIQKCWWKRRSWHRDTAMNWLDLREGKTARKSQPSHVSSCQEDGGLDGCGRTQKTGFRACRGTRRHGGSLKNLPMNEKHQDYSDAQTARPRK